MSADPFAIRTEAPTGLCRCEVDLKYFSVGPVAALRVIGELDFVDVPMVCAALGDCLTRRPEHLVVDLAGLRFCCAQGMGVLVEAGSAAASAGIGYSFADCSPHLESLLVRIWGDQAPRRFPSTDEAIVEAITELRGRLLPGQLRAAQG